MMVLIEFLNSLIFMRLLLAGLGIASLYDAKNIKKLQRRLFDQDQEISKLQLRIQLLEFEINKPKRP